MKNYFVVIILLFGLLLQAQIIEGKVVSITDGDTFKLLEKDSILHIIRVANIDTPEHKQPFSQKAKEFTSEAIFNKSIKIEVLKKDRYGRLVALVYYDGFNLSRELVKYGYAWNYVKYSDDDLLISLENSARINHLGLWQDKDPVPPWEWRKRQKLKTK